METRTSIWNKATNTATFTNFFKILKAVTDNDHNTGYEAIKYIISNSDAELLGNITELFKSITNSSKLTLAGIFNDCYDDTTETFRVKYDTTQPFLNVDSSYGSNMEVSTR